MEAKSNEEKKLTEKGWKQAQQTGKHFRRKGIRFSTIIHSDMIRARQTLAAIMWELNEEFREYISKRYNIPSSSDLPVKQLTDFLESYSEKSVASDLPNQIARHLSPYCALSTSPFQQSGMAAIAFQSSLLNEGPPLSAPQPPIRNKRPTSKEEIPKHGLRIEAGFRLFVNPLPLIQWVPDRYYNQTMLPILDEQGRENVLVVGHANVSRYWICRALQIPSDAWLRISLYHGSVSQLSIVSDSDCANSIVSVNHIGDASFLDPSLLSR
ncbi:Serine/threonine-protein phosphatase pgam5, mitochondrial [Cichlidogyrus casuarinus]|uniref:Serine/threonine-protein phosphatase PGAM5, mitochondrial n=1 Tax=Cichlidogyrus casuarinus TaxID=1844966 RepID=A0ABD2Q0A2_9PLAT